MTERGVKGMKRAVLTFLLLALCGVGGEAPAQRRDRSAAGGAVTTTAAGASVCDAGRMPGADVGAKIMACDAALGPSKGAIYHAGGGTVSTLVSPSPGHDLKFGCGTYRNTFGAGPFRPSSDVKVEGSGPCTVLQQFAAATLEQQFYVIVPINTFTARGATLGSPSRNIHVRDLTVDGSSAAGYGASAAAVMLGNCHGCSVERVRFVGVRAIGAQAGGPSAGGSDPSGLGMYAENVRIANCTFEGVLSQQVAVVNGREIYIERNVFRRADSSRQSQTVIDIEPNTPTDKNENIYVLDNDIDNRGGTFVGGVNGIGVQGVAGAAARNIVVRGNRVVGGEHAGATKLTIGIFVSGTTENVRIEGNEVRGANASAFRLYATGSHRGAVLRGNTAVNSGSGGGSNYAVEVGACQGCVVEENSILWDPSVHGNSQVMESGASSVIYRGNRFKGNRFSGITRGPKSRESGTIF